MDRNISVDDLVNQSFISIAQNFSKLSTLEILINLTISLISGLFIYYVYKRTFQGVLYQKSFNVSLVVITMISSIIIMTISDNLVLSLGMVGALSIVRFRTPIKDTMDLVFIFWAIAVGIANGVGYFNISIIGSIFITITLFIMVKLKDDLNSYLLIIHTSDASKEKSILEEIKSYIGNYSLKSKTITSNYREVILEVNLNGKKIENLDSLKDRDGVEKFTLISYKNEFKNS
jgi:uncharacterized membrane protein YhiD involved in acid resistance